MTRFFGLCLMALMLCHGAAAASDKLDGNYVLDPDASDDPSPLMKILGMGAAERLIARNMKTKMTFDGSAEKVLLTLKTPIGENESDIPTDGTTVEVESGDLGSGTLTGRWAEDGGKFVVESNTTSASGKTIHAVTTRFLEDADTLIQQFDVTIEGEKPVTLRRVFRRQE